ncbi:Dynamin-2 [Arthrobotrys entomopaga]|nr:Dynamin-2 [Arthrobotrys entomopaga]
MDNSSSLNTTSLTALQDDGHRKILDLVDQLKRIGLSSVLSLPQLVVCGDQSSGKSSVLEAITEIPFPRKENLCTRFATEIILRRAPERQISITITPGKDRDESEKQELMKFQRTINDFEELPELMEDATAAMGLGVGKAFSRDVLTVDISGPDRPQLTLVDLPGLIHAKNKAQSQEDVELIKSLVKEYISNRRTIILAIISAKNDYANQIILEYCRKPEVDPEGKRTLGVITKPDYLRSGSENEKNWIDLACNKDIHLQLGWHMVKNRGEGDSTSSAEARNEAEKQFFLQHPYSDLPRDMVGVGSLRNRLSMVLRDHLKRELPDLRNELNVLLQKTNEELSHLGKSRGTLSEQKHYLMGVAMEVYQLTNAAIKGQYDHPFFGSIEINSVINANENIIRLRATVQELNSEFARNMRLYGRKYTIGNKPGDNSDEKKKIFGDDDEDVHMEEQSEGRGKQPALSVPGGLQSPAPDSDDGADPDLPRPGRKSHCEAVEWVCEVLRKTRGTELPGNFDPKVIGYLFQEQSEPWQEIASLHINRVADICYVFVKKILGFATTATVRSRLMEEKVEQALKTASESAKEELRKIVADKALHLITYNHYYTTTVQKLRHLKYRGQVNQIALAATVTVSEHVERTRTGYDKQYISPDSFQKHLTNFKVQQDMDKFSAEDALDCEQAIYKCEMKYFIDVVAKQVIERHLVQTLPKLILAPTDIMDIPDTQIEYLVAEPTDIVQRRKFLEGRKAMLEEGQATFKKAASQWR